MTETGFWLLHSIFATVCYTCAEEHLLYDQINMVYLIGIHVHTSVVRIVINVISLPY
jgi:hypothetical protein